MRCPGPSILVTFLLLSCGAHALTGSGESGTVSLETVSPRLQSATVVSPSAMSAVFSEPMLAPGIVNPANYAVSGSGAGTLNGHPRTVSGSGPYALAWTSGEMRGGSIITLTVTGVQDLVGNLIDPGRNSASKTAVGVAPVFSALSVSPAQATFNGKVTITFTASEPLDGDPLVTVNGHTAQWVSGAKAADFTYSYTIQAGDPLGMAAVFVAGYDLAGNLGALSNSKVLEVTKTAPRVPLRAWPLGAVLLAAGMLCLVRRRRCAAALLLVLTALAAAPAAHAEKPTVTNVTLAQVPNGTLGTKVDIYYDLVAPNGPCNVTLSLSKNGGADGYIHPVRHCTGDITGVYSRPRWHIVWDIRADYPEEIIPQARIRVTADDGLVQHTLTYAADANGSIDGVSPQTVDEGTDGMTVTAVANPGYLFNRWSDGSIQNPRTDTNVRSDISVTASFVNGIASVSSFALNGGDAVTGTVKVTLNSTCAGTPAQYMASESPSFTGASWVPYDSAPSFSLSGGVGNRTVHFKVRNAYGESNVVNDTIFLTPETVPVQSGTFIMGRTASGDDAAHGSPDEDPRHEVTLGAYQLGKYDVTNREYCDVLNWAQGKGYLKDSLGAPWAGAGDVYAGGNLQSVLQLTDTEAGVLVCEIQYSGGVFSPKTRAGLPGGTNHPMDRHPAVDVTWYGAAAFCNWLSQMEGLAPCYDMTAANWPLTVPPPAVGGYRLPTEAEWERAAAWDSAASGGPKHWVYGFAADTLTGKNRANYLDSNPLYVNPLGLAVRPFTAPVGWFDGVNVSPNGSVATVNGASPVGCYDMCGEVLQWCGDWYDAYGADAQMNPLGPTTGSERVLRGGSWQNNAGECRSAARFSGDPSLATANRGFRHARSKPSVVLNSFAINSDAPSTGTSVVTLNNACSGGPTAYMASESPGFTGASWETYGTAPSFTLSSGIGTRTVYFKVQNANGESNVVSDSIFLAPEMASVAAGTFTMGRTASGDDAAYGATAEDPRHQVTLAAYQIGKCGVTNREYCYVLNWALEKGYLKNSTGAAWPGTGDLFAGGNLHFILYLTDAGCNIQYSDGVFTPKTRPGLPDATNQPMDMHPVVDVTWYGAAAFCNWLGEMQGLAPCYDMATANWPLTAAPPTSGGYRLPTEAEWERAAAWNGSKHWIYGFTSDTNVGNSQCNDYARIGGVYAYVNPLGLGANPYTSPAGWFDGVNVSPNGDVQTANSASPAGCYDMSGNVWQWCSDWYAAYGAADQVNPVGPATGSNRVLRGGGWSSYYYACRSAARSSNFASYAHNNIGFRLAR